MKHILILLLTIVSCTSPSQTYKEGDVVFIESQSSQSPYIKLVQGSKWTHCGIVVQTSNGLQVLEASNVVKLTPIDRFISKSKSGYTVVRLKNEIKPIRYSQYLGLPYDLEFKSDNNKFYCSELVYQIYKDQGITCCHMKKVSDYWLTRIPKIQTIMKKRNIEMDQYVISPKDLYNSFLW